MSNPMKYKFELSLEDTKVLLDVLAELPSKVSRKLLNHMETEIVTQNEAQKKSELDKFRLKVEQEIKDKKASDAQLDKIVDSALEK